MLIFNIRNQLITAYLSVRYKLLLGMSFGGIGETIQVWNVWFNIK